MARRGMMGRYRGRKGAGLFGARRGRRFFGWRVDGEMDQFGVVMGNWTSSLGHDWQLGQFGGKCANKLDQFKVR